MTAKVERIVDEARTRHGYASVPVSRAYWCAQNRGQCGDIEAEPQSVEAAKGFPAAGPPDGQLASGGHERFASLDGVRAPSGEPWPASRVTAGAPVRFRWWLTAPHRTAKWEYFITRDGWDAGRPLMRASFEPEPFTRIEWPCPGEASWRCHVPQADVHHWGILPMGKAGRHVIYAVWTVADTAAAFYSTIDVDFGA